MSLIQWNIRGITANHEQIKILFKETNAAAICLQETKLGRRLHNVGHNYKLYRSTPLNYNYAQGGTCIIVRSSFNHKEIPINSVLQACAIRIFTHRWVTLCSLYLEPLLENRLHDISGHPRQLTLDDLQGLINQLPPPFILMGDFNARHTLWGETACSRWGNLIEQLIDNNNLVIMNDGSPTRHDIYHNTLSAIDLSLCSSSIRLDYVWSVDDDKHGSDHFPIHLSYTQNIPSSCLPRWKVSEADWISFSESMATSVDVSEFSSATAAYEYFADTLLQSAHSHVPRTSGQPNRPVVPWWNKSCAVHRKITRICYKRYRRYPSDVNRISFCRARAKEREKISLAIS
ncbi:MAG: endonuclease/exonuclease/phosphatase family protein [Bacteroidota bacterium]